MFEAVIALSTLMSGVSVYQTGQALSVAERQQAFAERQDQATVEKLHEIGVNLGKQMRTLRYCKDRANMVRLRQFVVGRMEPYGPYGEIVISTMDELTQTEPDLSKAPPHFSCAANNRIVTANLSRAEKQR